MQVRQGCSRRAEITRSHDDDFYGRSGDKEVAHHASVLVFEDVAMVREVPFVVREMDCYLHTLTGPNEHRVAQPTFDDSMFDCCL